MKTQKDFLQQILEKAATLKKHIVLPEGQDSRTIEAAKKIVDLKIATVTLLGNEVQIISTLKGVSANLDDIEVVSPQTSNKLNDYAEQLYQLRKDKGVTGQA